MGLQDALMDLHPEAREFTYTASNGSSSATIGKWLISDSLLHNISAASVTDLILSDHYGLAVSVSTANAPLADQAFGPCLLPYFSSGLQSLHDSSVQGFPACQTSAHSSQPGIQVSQLKVHIHNAPRGYCFTYPAAHFAKGACQPSSPSLRGSAKQWQRQANNRPWMSCTKQQQLSNSIASSRQQAWGFAA